MTPPAPPTAATMVLEDGTTFRGEGFGAVGTAVGEAVFNTAMTGYQEVLTDPSYHRQVVAMTTPHIGNYGITPADAESRRVQVAAFVAREASRVRSNHRATEDLQAHLAAAGVVGIAEVDTRRLVRHLRTEGAMRAAVSTEVHDADELQRIAAAAPSMEGAELASEVTTPEAYEVTPPEGTPTRFRVVALDFGMKRNQLQLLTEVGCHVTVVPAATSAADVLARDPDGIFLSNGPGDPAAVRAGIAAIAELLPAEVPTFGICLGHQLLAKAAGARTYKLRFGHRGGNHPVGTALPGAQADAPGWFDPDAAKRAYAERAGHGVGGAPRVEITSQNHGFAVDADSLGEGPFGRVVQTHVNLSDGTNEGIALADLPAFSVQYHPESAPGPHDARYLFAQFTALMSARAARTAGEGR